MTDTNHHAPAGIGPVEGDGVQYRGIIWFLVIMALTVVVSAGLMVGAFKWFDRQAQRTDEPRSPLAPAAGQKPPAPNLLYMATGAPQLNEPGHLEQFVRKEEEILTGYAYDTTTGAARIPIERAKALLLERGLPTRERASPPKADAATPTKDQ